MLILRPDLSSLYSELTRCAMRSIPVHVFVSTDCDSILAIKMLSALFRVDHIPYQVKPVASYQDLRTATAVIAASETPSALLLLNCGATVDLGSFIALSEDSLVYVIDSHRPYHLSNVREHQYQIRIVDDTDSPAAFPDEADLYSSDDEEDEDEDEDDIDARLRRERRSKVAEYYRGSYHATCASVLLYELARQLGRDNNDLLWCAIVGLTDQFIHARIGRLAYEETVQSLRSEVYLKNSRNAEEEESRSLAVEGTITFEHFELAFYLLRHWNLFESMCHSPYISTQLQVWKTMGLTRLKTLLARMGIPLKESQTNYRFMRGDCKKILQTRIEQGLQQMGLSAQEVVYASFRRYGGSLQVSASDAVLSICAYLEGDLQEDAALVSESAFWKAYECVNERHPDVLESGFALAIDLQKSIMEHTKSILNNNQIHCPGPFRYCLMEPLPNSAVFYQPMALTRLALFVREAYQNQFKRAMKPFILCALNKARKTYLIAGIPAPQSIKEVYRNSFGSAFAQAAAECDARIKHDGFEVSIMEVQQDDMSLFLDTLACSGDL